MMLLIKWRTMRHESLKAIQLRWRISFLMSSWRRCLFARHTDRYPFIGNAFFDFCLIQVIIIRFLAVCAIIEISPNISLKLIIISLQFSKIQQNCLIEIKNFIQSFEGNRLNQNLPENQQYYNQSFKSIHYNYKQEAVGGFSGQLHQNKSIKGVKNNISMLLDLATKIAYARSKHIFLKLIQFGIDERMRQHLLKDMEKSRGDSSINSFFNYCAFRCLFYLCNEYLTKEKIAQIDIM